MTANGTPVTGQINRVWPRSGGRGQPQPGAASSRESEESSRQSTDRTLHHFELGSSDDAWLGAIDHSFAGGVSESSARRSLMPEPEPGATEVLEEQ